MKVYLIPGLGADKRMYTQQVKILPDAVVIEHLRVVKDETITDYAKRVAALIDTSLPFALIGTSLGGIVCVELSRIISPEKIILISSVKNRNELPLLLRSMKYLHVHKLLSGERFKHLNKLIVKMLGSGENSQTATLLEDMANDTPVEFIEWAIDAIVRWYPPEKCREDIIHIHGTKDRLLPFSKIKNAVAVNGTHVINMTMSEEVNCIILDALNSK